MVITLIIASGSICPTVVGIDTIDGIAVVVSGLGVVELDFVVDNGVIVTLVKVAAQCC